MVPFYVLVAAFLLFKAIGLIGVSFFEGWHTSLQGVDPQVVVMSHYMMLMGKP